MKNKYLKYTLLSIAISSSLLLTSCGCGKKSEPLNEASTDTTTIEETVEEEKTVENTNKSEAVENTTKIVENTNEEIIENDIETTGASNGEGQVDTPSSDGFSEGSGFNPSENITQNPDGSYTFSDEFMVSVQTINGFSDLTPENQQKLLQDVATFLVEMDNEEDVIAALSSFVGMYEYDQAVAKQEQAQQKPQQTQTQQKPQNNVSNSGEQSNNNTPTVNSQEQVIGGPPCADGTDIKHLGTGTISSWR